ncbi:hypothetical protein [Psychrobacillus sp. OK032]|uniref:hypothetical protein n=1 Tax=Psychrobacillus sp. OK032 TaxID=1884358 RepID=UPI0008CEC690|nr:hypothetical protein [Psychrobacillus sp. OK032]SES45010.1 hypothetical protein SAMN05518872_11635 [Psychrobacillus sp. OK032]
MSNLLLLVIIILFLAIKISKKKHPNNKFLAQLGMAILVGAIIIKALMTHNGSKFLKYIIVIYGIISFIVIMVDIVISKKKQTRL